MIFASAVFLYWFLPAFLVLYYLSPKAWRSLVVAVCSYVFYGWWRPDFVFLMFFSTGLDYACGAGIARAQRNGERGRGWLRLSIFANLALLGYFKYANFGIDTANQILGSMGMESVSWTETILPVGISFFTFQTLSYTIDVYREHARPVERFTDFMCYVALFPQLIAGPIVRYQSVAEQLRERTHSLSRFSQGVLLFQMGLAKKVLIADLISPLATSAFEASHGLSTGDAWLGLLAYTFQIYFDFSGYSDMAIGLGLMIGFRFPVNFSRPYQSRSLTEFWHRWHITLSNWLRDYLYIPLGGNRKGPVRTYLNLFITMLLGGLWHGANWTFLAWGAWHGTWLAAERVLGRGALWRKAPRSLRVLLTMLVVMIGWVWFASPDLERANAYLLSLVGSSQGSIAPLQVSLLAYVVLLSAAITTYLARTSQKSSVEGGMLFVLRTQFFFLLAILMLHYQDHVPFLYYQF